MRLGKCVGILVAFLSVVSAGTAVHAREAAVAASPCSRNGVKWWQERHPAKLAEIAKRSDVNIVFLGDSITHYWEGHHDNWKKWTSGAAYRVLNLGFSGDRTEHVLWRIANGELDGYSAKVLVLMIGTNNAGHLSEKDEPASNVAAGVAAILKAVREKQPQAKIILCAILPRGKPADFAQNVPWRNTEANVLIRRMCDGENIIWCDFGNEFLAARGQVDKRLMPDSLHPSDAGYDVFGSAVFPVIDRILGISREARDHDRRMKAATAPKDDPDENYEWRDGTVLGLEGKAFADTIRPYDRLPASAEKTVGAGPWALSLNSAGMLLRFRTDSQGFRIRWKVGREFAGGGNMSNCGKSGIDVYRYSPQGCRFRKTGLIYAQDGMVDVPVWEKGVAEYIVNLPAYNSLVEVRVGFKKGSQILPASERKSGVTKPVVFYGTSITQGGCASRPGLGFVSVIGRRLDVPVVNLGFSGNGNMGGDIGDYLAKIDASCYVIDTLWNMNRQAVESRYLKFVEALKAKRPGVPIVLVGKSNVFNTTPDPSDAIARKTAESLGLSFVEPDGLYVRDTEGTIDGCHPNDYGMMQHADVIGAAVKRALNL